MKYVFLCVCLSAMLLSCNVTEPERYFNKETVKEESGTFTASNFDSTQWYTQSTVINARLDYVSLSIKKIMLYFDNLYSYEVSQKNNSFTFTINPKSFPNGKHTLIISVIGNGKGLLTLNNIGSLILKSSFYTYCTDSLKTEISKITANSKPQIEWPECKDNYFANYTIVRMIGSQYDTLSVISDSKTTSYTDNSYPDIYGSRIVSYQIITKGKYGYYISEFKSFDCFSAFTLLPFKEGINFNAFLPLNDGSLILTGTKISDMKHVDLSTGTIKGDINGASLNEYQINDRRNKIISSEAFSRGTLYLTDFSSTISNQKPYSLSKYTVYSLTFREINPDVMILSYDYYDGKSTNFVFGLFDLNTCRLIKEFSHSQISSSGSLIATNKSGIAYWYNYPGDLYKIDLTDTSNIKTTSLGLIYYFKTLAFINPDKLLLVLSNEISICDLNLNKIITKPVSLSILNSYMNGNTLVLKTKDNQYNYLEIYDIRTLNLVRKIAFNVEIQNLMVFPDESIVITTPGLSSTESNYYKLN